MYRDNTLSWVYVSSEIIVKIVRVEYFKAYNENISSLNGLLTIYI